MLQPRQMRYLGEVLALLALVVLLGLVLLFWRELGPLVPTHYGIDGRPDHYGPKASLVRLPAITLLLYGLLTVASFFPQAFNYPVPVTDENRGRLQLIATALLAWVKAEITWLFAYLAWSTVRAGLGVPGSLGWAFLPLTLALMTGTLVIGIAKMCRAAAGNT